MSLRNKQLNNYFHLISAKKTAKSTLEHKERNESLCLNLGGRSQGVLSFRREGGSDS